MDRQAEISSARLTIISSLPSLPCALDYSLMTRHIQLINSANSYRLVY